MRKRILSITLVMSLLCGMFIVGTASASGAVTLYTGGGLVYATDWSKSEAVDGAYTGSGTLPAPVMGGATFEGWYTNSAFTGAKASPGDAAAASSYYAKWSYKQGDTNGGNDSIRYYLTKGGASSYGLKAGEHLSAFFFGGGLYTAYSTSPLPSAGGPGNYGGTAISSFPYILPVSDIFLNISGDIYVGRTASLEGDVVRFTYYVQNRGSGNVTGFSLGAAADAQLGKNDYVPLRYTQNSGGYSYLSMLDTSAGNELRLYTAGQSLTKPDRLWWGGFQPTDNKNGLGYVQNTFNNGRDAEYTDKVDSAFSFSWENISLTPGETKSYSVLLGIGDVGDFTLGYGLSYDLNGATGSGLGSGERYPYGEMVQVTSTVPTYSHYVFTGWNTKKDGTGINVQSGEYVPMVEETTLYAQWALEEYEATVTLTLDGEGKSGQSLELWQGDRLCTAFTDDGDGTYTAKAIDGNYQVYMNGKYISQLRVYGDVSETFAYSSAKVDLKKDGTAWADCSVGLYKNGFLIYTLVYDSVEKKYIMPFLAQGEEYDIYLDGANTGETLMTGTTAQLNYYSGEVTVRKDSVVWAGADVKLGQMQATLTNGKFVAVVKGGQTAYVNGITVGAVSSSSKTLSADFYTLTFYDGTESYGESTAWKPQVLLSGAKAEKPSSNPTRSDAVFVKWITANGGSTEFNFNSAITGKTSAYASWSKPVVITGDPARLSNTTYKLPSLSIVGYPTGHKVSNVKIALSRDSVAVTGTGYTAIGNNTKNLEIIFDAPKTVAQAEAFLQSNITFTVTGTSMQTVDITVYAAQ